LNECPFADGALVRFLPAVYDSMIYHDIYASGCFTADGTLIRFCSTVYDTVLLHFSSIGEHFIIIATLVTILPRLSIFSLAYSEMVRCLSMVYDIVSLQDISSTITDVLLASVSEIVHLGWQHE
jgi:hypothetical protein